MSGKSSKLIDAASPVAGVVFNLGAGATFFGYGLYKEGLGFLVILGLLFLGNGFFSVYRFWIRRRRPDHTAGEA